MRLTFDGVLLSLWFLISLGRRIVLDQTTSVEDTSSSSLKPLAEFLLASNNPVATSLFAAGVRSSHLLSQRHPSRVSVLRQRSSPVAEADVAQQEETIVRLPMNEEEEKIMQSFLEAASSKDDLMKLWEEHFETMTPPLYRNIFANSQEEGGPWLDVMAGFHELRTQKMEAKGALLQEMLDSGEIRKLDAMVNKAATDKLIDGAFLQVLNDNIEVAREADNEVVFNLLVHIQTRCSEELEKLAPPEQGILAKLMRMPDESIRANIYDHYLVPQTKITLPDGTEIDMDDPKPAMIEPIEFAKAVAEMVTTLRKLDMDGDMITEAIEDLRTRAKEARAVIVENYPEDVINEFSDYLMPVFVPGAVLKIGDNGTRMYEREEAGIGAPSESR